MDGGVVQVIPVVGRSLDKRVSQLVCPAAWDHVGPIVVVSCSVVTSGVSGDIVRLLSGSTDTRFYRLQRSLLVIITTTTTTIIIIIIKEDFYHTHQQHKVGEQGALQYL